MVIKAAKYEILPPLEFSRELLRTGDLDPVYVAVHHAGLEPNELRHWLLAYWCFYHCGTASWVVDQPDYWKAMAAAADTAEHPRASERRHFRGAQARESVAWLRGRGVDTLFASLLPNGGQALAADVMTAVRDWKQFGPWIAFKVADMIDRLGLARVTFSYEDALYEAPRQGAELVYELCGPKAKGAADPVRWAVGYLLKGLEECSAPPRFERPVGYAECETCLCKFKSHHGGHYPVGKDVAEVRHGLLRYPRSRTAQALLRGGKEGGLW